MRLRLMLVVPVVALAGCPQPNDGPECGNDVVEDGEICDADPANAACDECAAITCDAGFEDCNGEVADGCEVNLCGGTCEEPGGGQRFEYTGTIETLTLPECASTVTIEAWGAQGGGGVTVSGGEGAHVKAEVPADGGETLRILVGGAGQDGTDVGTQGGGSGGGGSFVVDEEDQPWVVAGGGGGAIRSIDGVVGAENQREVDGGPGQTTQDGQDGDGGGLGGTEGAGGGTFYWEGWHAGTGGGGLLTSGSATSAGLERYGTVNQPGQAFVDGGAGGVGGSEGRNGGFGGGGAAGFTGGGGGGYSGGGSSAFGGEGLDTYGGGGGGSYAAGTLLESEAGVREGNGQVDVRWE